METLEQKIATYQKCKLNIEILQEELRQEQEKLTTVEKEILMDDYEFLPASYIQRLPVELLSIIFAYFIQDKPTHIRRLLLVCRGWTYTITNSPSFWTNIQIIPEPTLDISRLLSQITYVRTCIKRSQGMLLNIVADYRNWIHVEEAPSITRFRDKFEELYNSLANACLDDIAVIKEDEGGLYIMEKESGRHDTNDTKRVDDLKRILGDLDWISCPIETQVKQCFFLSFQHLVGKNGEVMKRWNSVDISFPPGSISFDPMSKGLELFIYPTPFLESISLDGNYEGYSDLNAFPYAPSLRTLRLFTSTTSLLSPIINPSQLVDLYICVETFEQLRLLSLSSHLRRLGLHFLGHLFYIPNEFTLDFPHLQELILQASIPTDLRGVIYAPRLETLHLTDDEAFESIEECSSITASVKRLVLIDCGNHPSRKTIAETIPKFVSLREINVHPRNKEPMEECLRQLCDSGHLNLLQVLVLGKTYEDFEDKIISQAWDYF